MSEQKPREFWISTKTKYVTEKNPSENYYKWQKRKGEMFERIHVIEYSAYEQVVKEFETLGETYRKLLIKDLELTQERDRYKAALEHIASNANIWQIDPLEILRLRIKTAQQALNSSSGTKYSEESK